MRTIAAHRTRLGRGILATALLLAAGGPALAADMTAETTDAGAVAITSSARLGGGTVTVRPGERVTVPVPAGVAEPTLGAAAFDRVLRAGPDGGIRVGRGGSEVSLGPQPVAFQRRADQLGLVARLSPAGDGDGAAVVLAAFRGDALIALENAGAPSAASVAPAGPAPRPAELPGRSDPTGRTSADALAAGELVWFPDEARVFRPLEADPREARMQVGLMYACRRDEDPFLDAQLGGDLGIIRQRIGPDREYSLSVRGLMTSRFNAGRDNFPQYNTDFIAGLAGGYRTGDHAFELLFYHQSSHLGDEILDWSERSRIDYARETVRLLWGWDVLPNVRLYAGPSVHVRAWPQDLRGRLVLQGGVEYRFDVLGQPMYAALDVQAREATEWNVNVAGQVGIELGDPDLKLLKRPKLFLEAFNGNSNMGQFWDENQTHVMVGLKFEI